MEEPILILDRYGVAFGEQNILADVSLVVPARGVTVLLGPVSTGKSTLLRTLAGFNDAQPAFRWWGTATYAGAHLGRADRPALVSQNARLMLDSVFENMASALPERHTLNRAQQKELIERLLTRCQLKELCDRLADEVIQLPLGIQRRLAIARTVAPNPHLLLLDEPTAGLSDDEASALLELVRIESDRRAILMVTHNQEHARAVASHVALLVGGKVQESSSTEQFFQKPDTEVARQYVRTGSCSLPPAEDSTEVESEPIIEVAVTRSVGAGPRGFRWLKPGILAGTPRPGIIDDVDYDLESLRRVGIRVLVTLEEEPFDTDLLAKYEIQPAHLAVPDMHAPTVAETIELCERVNEWTRAGTPVAFHCRAGLGRTGTLLACQLIWDGWSPLDALDRVRQIEPRWVQSEVQVNHLKAFSEKRPRKTRSSNGARKTLPT